MTEVKQLKFCNQASVAAILLYHILEQLLFKFIGLSVNVRTRNANQTHALGRLYGLDAHALVMLNACTACSIHD